MARLLVLRHGKTEAISASGSDFDRELVDRGRRNAAAIGEVIGRDMPAPDLVLASPAARARQTADCVLSTLAPGREAVIDERIYGGSEATLHDVVLDHAGGAATVLIIGHNPGMARLVRAMLPAGEGDAASHFPTCALADIEFAAASLDGIAPGQGRLVALLRPKELGLK